MRKGRFSRCTARNGRGQRSGSRRGQVFGAARRAVGGGAGCAGGGGGDRSAGRHVQFCLRQTRMRSETEIKLLRNSFICK